MKMQHLSISFILFYIIVSGFGTINAQQKSISRIDQMPNKPSPYQVFDWKSLAKVYNAKVFDLEAKGSYLPITTISADEGINYPSVHNIRMSTYVGQDNKNTAEAINILPALVGASLVGVDKMNDNNINWIKKTIDFFNKKNGQNVYLNNYSSTTGNDWWYELMPNVFFYQLYDLYPNGASEFKEQFNTVADRQLDVLYKLGGTQQPWVYPNLNYRAFNLETGKGNESGIKEPESAGSIAWLLYSAYKKTNDKKYLIGTQLALDFLENTTDNPSYEIQLPYGIVTAAKLNAVENTNYDIDKFLNWAFSDGKNTLRGWGVIVGNWNGYDVSGLIGEAKDAGDDYAFLLNGFQHAAALAPVAKYDKRYAKAIGKWLLNLSNASRYFYPGQLPKSNQEAVSLEWSNEYDASKSIPYESLKQKQSNVSPYATSDALAGGWAPTNLSLYSGSSVGYLAALLDNTNIEGILQIDLNVTDFGSANEYKNYLYYNPGTTAEIVNVNLPQGGAYNVYDAITEKVLFENVSGTAQLIIPSNDVRIVVLYPAGLTITQKGKLLQTSEGKVIDYHYKWNYDPTLRIKSLYSTKTELQAGDSIQVNVLAQNAEGVTYEWYINNVKQDETTDLLKWTAIDKEGISVIKSIISKDGETATDSININILSSSNVQPEIKDLILSDSNPYNLSSVVKIKATTNTTDTITWKVSGGEISSAESLEPTWTLPDKEGIYTLDLTIKNKKGTASKSVNVLVKDINSHITTKPIVYYPMDGNTLNAMGDALNAISEAAVLTTDPQGEEKRAYRFDNNEQYIYTLNDNALNFQDKMTLSFWINPTNIGKGEQFVLSHGSWEERYKVSLTPEKKVRFTLNTTDRIVDIDDNYELENNKYVHYTFVFTGYSVEIYRNGVLSNFTNLGGKINKSTKVMTMGRRDQSTTDYTYQGSIDEVKLFNDALDVNSIAKLPTEFQDLYTNSVEIKSLTIDGTEWNINNKYIIDCNNTKDSLAVNIETYPKAKIDTNTFKVNITKASVHELKFTITSEDGTITKEYTLKIEVPFKSSEIISQKWNKVLTVNNNSTTNGGFNFTGYQWYKNGELVSSKQYYAVGTYTDEILDPTGLYSVIMTMDNGNEIRVCPFSIEAQKTASVRVYPTKANVGEKICIDANIDSDILKQSEVGIYTIEGTLVKKLKVNDAKTYFDLPNTGLYILKYESQNGYNNSFKLIIK